MATEALTDFPAQLETLFHQGALGRLTDGELLGRFLDGNAQGAEAAFATLVERHAPMVMRVCRGALTIHDAEDAAQAVFLVLARRARSLRRGGSAASWLYGVARRVAARARRDAARRLKHERRRAEMAASHTQAPGLSDSGEGIYDEIDALPEIYRSAIVLCYLEGLSHEQAARSIGCPLRTLQSRLLRARERLRSRLARRGVSLPAALPPLANAVPPSAAWVKATAGAARVFAAGQSPLATAGASAASVSLARLTLRAAVHVPGLIAGAILAAGFALVVVTAARDGGKTDPPPALPQAGPPAIAAPSDRDPKNRTLVLQVVDRASRAPIEGAEVQVQTETGARAGLGGDPALFARSATDRDGRYTIEFPPALPVEIYVTARKRGYADRGYAPFAVPGGKAIPRSHTIEMERGVAIGGVVKDRRGGPIAGASVLITARAGVELSPDYSYLRDVRVTTDPQGRWRFGEMPTGWTMVYLQVTHPDYVPSRMLRDFRQPGDLLLKAKKAESILEEGLPLAGTVVDDRGRPIAGASVGLGADRRIRDRSFPSVATDAAGRFRFDHIPGGMQTITAQAPGRAPELVEVFVAPGLKPVEFRLGPGHSIRGRVVDRLGKPLDGVTVQAMDWKKRLSLDWTTTTDAEGRFKWDSAPAEPVSLTLTRPGNVMIGQREFQPDRGEATVTMYPPLRVRGTVTDAETGRPIERFTLVHGNYYQHSNQAGVLRNVNWERGGPWNEYTGGSFEVEFAYAPVAAVALRVEAQGYSPATSSPFRLEAGDVTFDARLERGDGPSGVVHGPDGRPLAGAVVVLSTRSLQAQIYNGKFHEAAYPRVVTGSDGRFLFPAQVERFRVFVDHESGFAEVDGQQLAGAAPLVVRPWGRVVGIVKTGDRPIAGVPVRLSEAVPATWGPNEGPPITQAQELTTDARGRYAFEHVIPARLRVSRMFTSERSSSSTATATLSSVTVAVKSGPTTFVDLGGTGRTVVGRFKVPAGVRADALFPLHGQTLTSVRQGPPDPANPGAGEQAADPAPETSFDTNVRPDGRFRIEDVPPGKYRLSGQVYEPGLNATRSFGPPLASVDIEIVVPEVPGGRTETPLDVGTIELQPIKPRG